MAQLSRGDFSIANLAPRQSEVSILLLTFVIANCLLLNLIVQITSQYMDRLGLLEGTDASGSVFEATWHFLRFTQYDDSLRPMLQALRLFSQEPDVPLYHAIFFDHRIKFQYPLSSLLPLWALERLGLDDGQVRLVFNGATWVSVWVVIGVAMLIAKKAMRDRLATDQSSPSSLVMIPIVLLAGLLIYPLAKAYAPYALANTYAWAIEGLGLNDHHLRLLVNGAMWLLISVLVGIAVLIAKTVVRTFLPVELSRPPSLTIISIVLAGLCFYPLVRAYALGQIQTILAAGFAIAFYCWICGRATAAGAVIGLMTLVKPQYAVLVLWAVVRKQWGTAAAAIACITIGGLMSVLVFGWSNNLDYLEVLRTISRHGELFYANQSVNGILNRLLADGNNLRFALHEFPPFHPGVYGGTLLASAILIGLALAFPWGRAHRGGVADFACVAVAATIASPVAWEHHYSIFFPIFAWVWFTNYAASVSARCVLAVSYVLVGNFLSPLNALHGVFAVNIVQSYVFLGALMLFGLLMRPALPVRKPVHLAAR